jgi:hypothetical protein
VEQGAQLPEDLGHRVRVQIRRPPFVSVVVVVVVAVVAVVVLVVADVVQTHASQHVRHDEPLLEAHVPHVHVVDRRVVVPSATGRDSAGNAVPGAAGP